MFGKYVFPDPETDVFPKATPTLGLCSLYVGCEFQYHKALKPDPEQVWVTWFPKLVKVYFTLRKMAINNAKCKD